MGEERGNTFIMLLKERRKGACGNAINSKDSWNSGGSYTGRPSESESLWKKMIGKPCAGKLHARFDEGELEIEHSATTPALYSTEVTVSLFTASCTVIFSILPILYNISNANLQFRIEKSRQFQGAKFPLDYP